MSADLTENRNSKHRGARELAAIFLLAAIYIGVSFAFFLLSSEPHPGLPAGTPETGVSYVVYVSRGPGSRHCEGATVSYVPQDRPWDEGEEWNPAATSATTNSRGRAVLYVPYDDVTSTSRPCMFYFRADHPEYGSSAVGLFGAEIDQNGIAGGTIGLRLDGSDLRVSGG